MGKEQSYKAFFGFEISTSRSFWKAKAYISLEEELLNTDDDHFYDGRNAFENQMKPNNYQVKQERIEKSDTSNCNIHDAVFEMVSEKDGLKKNRKANIQRAHKKHVQVTVSRKIKTYMHIRDFVNKGSLFDTSV